MSSSASVTLGSQRTACDRYKAWSYGVNFVVSTNRRVEEVRALPLSHQQ
jgi:hypothetical protein